MDICFWMMRLTEDVAGDLPEAGTDAFPPGIQDQPAGLDFNPVIIRISIGRKPIPIIGCLQVKQRSSRALRFGMGEDLGAVLLQLCQEPAICSLCTAGNQGRVRYANSCLFHFQKGDNVMARMQDGNQRRF